MYVRQAAVSDLDRIMQIYDSARAFMSASGNPRQWDASYPSRQLLQKDIEQKQAYVCVEDSERVCGVFVFCLGEDPTYRSIEEGTWPDSAPYGTIHRIASDGSVRGVFSCCISFCRRLIPTLRADTHEDNHPMQRALAREGFQRCGIIHLENGDPRIAYQLSPSF